MNPHVMLVTASSSDFRPLADITEVSKIDYARRHDMPFWSRTHRDGATIPDDRVSIWRECLPWCEWMMFMGADTMIMRPDIPPSAFIDDRYDLVIAEDVHHINNDVFFMRNCPAMQVFLAGVQDALPEFADEQQAMIAFMEGFEVKRVESRVFNSYHTESHPYLHSVDGYIERCVYQPGDFCLHLTNLPIARRIELATEYARCK